MATPEQAKAKQALAEAAKEVGGQTKLADALSAACDRRVSQQWIWNVINREGPIPAEWCLPIETITKGKVRCHSLRPDLYPLDAVTITASEHRSPASPAPHTQGIGG